jgi:Mrp family chromosome partitioning ATPase/capsular polysaccharide biosynthesis protein
VRHFEYLNLPTAEQITASRSTYEPSNLIYLLSVARRRQFSLIMGLIGAIIVGTTYSLVTKPKFTATTNIFIDAHSRDSLRRGADTSDSTADSAEIDSQVEVIRSWQVANAFIKKLSPDERKQLASEFEPNPYLRVWPASSATIKASSSGQIGSEIDPDRVLLSLSVSRVERTNVLAISFTASSAILAAHFANSFVEAYQNVLTGGRRAGEQQKRDWIQQRIDETRSALLLADGELQAFRPSPVVGESDAAKRELELRTDTYQKLYQSLLQQQQQGFEEESFPQGEFHVITPAEPTATHRSPRLSFVFAMSLFAGLGGGSLIAALREVADQSLRTSGQVEELLGARFLGWLPSIRKRKSRRRRLSPEERASGEAWVDGLPTPMRYSTDNPKSPYAETLRAIRVKASSLPPGDGPKVIGVISALPREGKSILSVNLGRLLSREGARLLLIDGDVRDRGLSRILAPSAQSGLYEALDDSRCGPQLVELLITDATSGMYFLPIADTMGRERCAMNKLAVKFDALLMEAKKRFDIIVVDFPPLAAVADARSLCALSDCFVLVVEWGKTNKGAVRKFLNTERGIKERLLGVVLNKVKLRKLKLYEQGDDPQYHPFRSYFSENES